MLVPAAPRHERQRGPTRDVEVRRGHGRVERHGVEAEAVEVPEDERHGEDRGDVGDRLLGERAVDHRERPVGRWSRRFLHAVREPPVAHVVGRHGELPRPEPLVEVREVLRGGLGGPLDAPALVVVRVHREAVDARGARLELPEAHGALGRHGGRREAALDEDERLEVRRHAAVAEGLLDGVAVASAALQPPAKDLPPGRALGEVLEEPLDAEARVDGQIRGAEAHEPARVGDAAGALFGLADAAVRAGPADRDGAGEVGPRIHPGLLGDGVEVGRAEGDEGARLLPAEGLGGGRVRRRGAGRGLGDGRGGAEVRGDRARERRRHRPVPQGHGSREDAREKGDGACRDHGRCTGWHACLGRPKKGADAGAPLEPSGSRDTIPG